MADAEDPVDDRTPWVAFAAALCGAAGLAEGAFVSGGSGALLGIAALSTGLWLAFGLLFGVVIELGSRTALGLGWSQVASRTVDWLSQAWGRRAERLPADRLSLWISRLAGLAAFLTLSGAMLVYLIRHRHGATLITATFLGFQVVAVAVGWWLSRVLGRILCARPLQRALAKLSGSVVFGLAAVAALVGLGGAIYLYQTELWDALRMTTWVSLTGTAVIALLVAPIIGRRLSRRLALGGLLISVVLAAVLTAFGGSDPIARRLVAVESAGASVLLATVQELSDFDGDGVGYLPGLQDCAPFDETISPLADDPADDGIDANCDGRDGFPAVEVKLKWEAPERPEVPKGKPDLVLITIDSWRADTTGFGSDAEGVTPNLDDVAAKGVVFTNAWSQDSGTGPSMWSLMSGKTPFQTKLQSTKRFPPPFAKDETTLAEWLKKGGYRTYARLCGGMFAKPHWNIKRGFGDFEEVCKKRRKRQAEVVAENVVPMIEQLYKNPRPFFLWIHLFDPHKPYSDHEDQELGDSKRDHYLEEVAYTDRAMKPILDAVRAAPRRTYLAVTADHGENFGEHGKAPHARTLYREVTHVPLFFWGTDVVAREVTSPVAINDIHPTFLQLAGVSTEHSTMTSHAPVLFGGTAAPDRLVFQENSFSRPRRHVKGVVSSRYHLLFDATNNVFELYDLREDPEQRVNLAGSGTPEEEHLRATVKKFVGTTTIPKKLAR